MSNETKRAATAASGARVRLCAICDNCAKCFYHFVGNQGESAGRHYCGLGKDGRMTYSQDARKIADLETGRKVPRLVKIEDVRAAVESVKTRSAWDRGVKAQALDFCDEMADWAAFDTDNKPGEGLAGGVIRCASFGELVELLRNGAEDWSQASWGGNGLNYDQDIAERYSTKSELTRTRNGELRPNSREDWLDVQARGMGQAAQMVARAWWKLANA